MKQIQNEYEVDANELATYCYKTTEKLQLSLVSFICRCKITSDGSYQ